MTHSKLRRIVLAAALASCASSAPALANEYLEQVQKQLTAAGDIVGGNGYRQVGNPHFNALGARASEKFPAHLEEGVEYIIVGVCDLDCTDLDMSLLDASGKTLVRDAQDDDMPVLRFTPNRDSAAPFSVRATMHSCASEPCIYGVGLYQR